METSAIKGGLSGVGDKSRHDIFFPCSLTEKLVSWYEHLRCAGRLNISPNPGQDWCVSFMPILRINRMHSFAAANRLQTSMKGAFWKPQETCARIMIGQVLLSVRCKWKRCTRDSQKG
uniref:Uncharacterized protein n=1 Tax=Salix viminalis TaxID=40686 RepID=A0A6N2JYK9_SALVM